MVWESVPWAVGGGAVHSAEMSRRLAYAAFGGSEGVLGFADLKVTQLGTPGAAVDVAAGGAAILNRTPNYGGEMYIGRNPSVDPSVAVAATGGGGGRVDMVVARVEDPWLTGNPWADPGDVTVGPYIFTRVISNVGAPAVASWAAARAYLAAAGESAVPLAGITLPLSTATVLTAHINDLRKIARPRTERRLLTHIPGSAQQVTSATLAAWMSSFSVDVPEWATTMVVAATVLGSKVDRFSASVNGTALGQIRVRLGTVAPVDTAATSYDVDAAFGAVSTRVAVGAADTLAVPVGYRGTTQTLQLMALRTAAGSNKNLYADTTSSLAIDLEWQEQAI